MTKNELKRLIELAIRDVNNPFEVDGTTLEYSYCSVTRDYVYLIFEDDQYAQFGRYLIEGPQNDYSVYVYRAIVRILRNFDQLELNPYTDSVVNKIRLECLTDRVDDLEDKLT